MRLLLLLAGLLPLTAWASDGDGYVRIPPGDFTSTLAYEDARGPVRIAPFGIMRHPVTNAEFLAFVNTHPAWRRDRVAPVFAGPDYLAHWQGPTRLVPGHQAAQPVTRVSWFAAAAYCEAQRARLPRWLEWEYVAAADTVRHDARADPAWRDRILAWYARPSSSALPAAGAGVPNAYGVRGRRALGRRSRAIRGADARSDAVVARRQRHDDESRISLRQGASMKIVMAMVSATVAGALSMPAGATVA